jgi:hypothetical protein
MSIDQARRAFLTLSLARLVTQQRKLSLEMVAIRRLRLELAVKGLARVPTVREDGRSGFKTTTDSVSRNRRRQWSVGNRA